METMMRTTLTEAERRVKDHLIHCLTNLKGRHTMTTTYAAGTGYWEAQDGKEVWVCEDGKQVTPLPLRLDIQNKSPTGFAWGYSGSGPAQLAVAILAHATDAVTASRLFHHYKQEVIAGLQQKEGFVITKESVLAWVEKQNEAALTPGERTVLLWLGEEEFNQYGECFGKDLDGLIAKGMAQVHDERVPGVAFIAPQGRSPMHRAVSLTDKGRLELRALGATCC
jgi:hypothetical protein